MKIPIEDVGALLRDVSEKVVLPKFLTLREEEIEEKSPGEIVTAVDREVESILSRKLTSLLPGSRVVGEEAVSVDPDLLGNLDEGLVWLVDPIDGTANFAQGSRRFAVMVALVKSGETLASWIHQPAENQQWVAESGSGAYCNGRKVAISDKGDFSGLPALVDFARLPALVKRRFLPEDYKHALDSVGFRDVSLTEGSGCAGTDYPELVSGSWRFLLYWRTLPWDHVPGALLASEAGANVARLDGSAFKAHASRTGLLIAPNKALWEDARRRFPTP
jgi:fructose-1,6-bisphosphatase/inositol monophosphatase family enzyme